MATNNAINLKAQGTVYYNGTGTFSGIDGSTSGFRYTSTGAGSAPSFQVASGSSELLVAKLTLTSAQIKALRATPIEIVAAPGAGKVIMPISAYYYFLYGGTDAFTNLQTCAVRINNAGTLTQIYELGPIGLGGTTSSFSQTSLVSSTSPLTSVPTDMINRQAIFKNVGASEITGNASNNNTLSIAMIYYVWTL